MDNAPCSDCGATFSPLYVGPWHEKSCRWFSPAWEPLKATTDADQWIGRTLERLDG